jgi:ElaB/YqjD/DUF883 family membrane-anchored ribosome-binding protein
MKIRALFLLAAVFLVASCGEDKTPELSVIYQSVVSVAKGNDVIYDRATVGKVEKVSDEGGASRVHISVAKDKIGMLHKGSAAMMTTFGGSPVVEIYDRGDGDALADGDELVALNNSLEYLAWQTGKTVDSAQSSLTELTASVESYFSGEEWAGKRAEVESKLEQLGVNAEKTMQQMQDDYDALVEDLEAKTEESAEMAQKHYDQLSENIEKQLKLLMDNGEETVAGTMQQFSETVETLMEKYAAENRK